MILGALAKTVGEGLMKRIISGISVVLGAALILTLPAMALDAGVKCQANKKKTAGKYALCRMKALAKSDRRAAPPDFTVCDTKFAKVWGKIESKAAGACPTAGDQSTIAALVDSCMSNVAASLWLPKRVFITSQGYMPGASGAGRFNSLATADAHCQALAEAATPPLAVAGYPVFKAWLSDSTSWPADGARFTQVLGPYVLVDGTPVASNWTDLTDNSIAAPINLDESGSPQCCAVWTATSANGTSVSDGSDTGGCTNWTTANPFPSAAAEGFANMTNATWSLASPLPCNQTARFYCFEQ